MERCYAGSDRCISGGIISLRRFIEEHREAVEADLITSAGIEIGDVGGSLSWGAFASFVKNLGYDSAVFRAQHPDMAEWGSTLKTNIILADIFDVLAQINSNIIAGFSHKKSKKPERYTRPWAKKKFKKIGSAVKRNELHAWMEMKRREAAKHGK